MFQPQEKDTAIMVESVNIGIFPHCMYSNKAIVELRGIVLSCTRKI